MDAEWRDLFAPGTVAKKEKNGKFTTGMRINNSYNAILCVEPI